MTVFIRTSRKVGETDEEFRKRDEAHWRQVQEAEDEILRQRERFKPTKEKARRV